MLAIDVDLIELPTTSLQLLIIVLGLSVLAGVGLVAVTALATPLVDRRWPADEPLNPTEMLWGESGGYIKRHFKGLDDELGKDINSQFTEVKVPAGEAIVEQGDPATHFYVLKEGEVEVSQELPDGSVQPIRRHGPGDTFGELGILRRTPRTATIRATVDSVVLQLPAGEFIAGVAFSAAEGNELLSKTNTYLAADAARATQASAPPPAPAPSASVPSATAPAARADTTTVEQPGAPAGGARRPGRFIVTHIVPASGLSSWDEPDPSKPPSGALAGGTELRRIGESGAWARVRSANGWEGWVDGRLLERA